MPKGKEITVGEETVTVERVEAYPFLVMWRNRAMEGERAAQKAALMKVVAIRMNSGKIMISDAFSAIAEIEAGHLKEAKDIPGEDPPTDPA